MMHYFIYSALASSLVATVMAVDPVLETSSFNVTEALLGQGINVSAIPTLAAYTNQSTDGCAVACNTLELLYGNESTDTRTETAYADFINSYWSSNQADVSPYCIFKPSNASQVSVVILLARLAQCPFAAKSGGHTAFSGASNVEGGITISFVNLKNISLSEDKSIASVEPGNIWGTVFEELTKSDVTVVGGRVYNVGVGGLTIGGGISYFSNLYGWACDNVESYEIVLANGVLATVSATQYSDLYWALRGGGNNFGLVVRFNLKTISLPRGEIWGGIRTYSEDNFPQVSNALINLINNASSDPKAGFYTFWAADGDSKIAMPALYYAQPDANNETIWSDFNAIPSTSDTTKNRIIGEWAKEMMDSSPFGRREIFYDITTKVDYDILTFARDAFYETLPSIANVSGITPYFIVQGITVPQLEKMSQNGGNPLGLDAADGPFFILQLAAMWNSKSDDEIVYKWISGVLEKVATEAKSRGVNNDYVYMNYASQFQDVIATYGESNVAELKEISAKYDPQQVFQVLQPGYFKLNRAPLPASGYFSS